MLTAEPRLPSLSLHGPWLAALALGALASAIVFLPTTIALTSIGAALAIPLAWHAIAQRQWLPIFFATLLLLPPIAFPIGDSGAHPAILAAGLAILGAFTRLDQWRGRLDSTALAILGLLFAMTFSLVFAAIYSGLAIAAGSAVRLVLFAFAPLVYFSVAFGPDRGLSLTRSLYWVAVAAALFGCVDFLYQLPAPAGYEPQFLWLDSGVYRRAQGLFYESSTLGNFCSFFLVFIAVCFTQPKLRRPISMLGLILGAALLGTAMLLSFSRASVLACLISLLVLAAVKSTRWRTWRSVAVMGVAAVVVMAIFIATVPEVAEGYWGRVQLAFDTIQDSPDRALSGRLANWTTVASFALDHPWETFFGIGYKTLPYTDYVGRPVIADNMYLSLLVETGVLGCAALIALNVAILRRSWRALRQGSLHGTWIFCFWIGESLQMLSGDILTYWRVLPVYFWVLAQATNDVREEAHANPRDGSVQ